MRWDERFWKWQKLTTLNSKKLQEIKVSDFNSVIISAKITGINSPTIIICNPARYNGNGFARFPVLTALFMDACLHVVVFVPWCGRRPLACSGIPATCDVAPLHVALPEHAGVGDPSNLIALIGNKAEGVTC